MRNIKEIIKYTIHILIISAIIAFPSHAEEDADISLGKIIITGERDAGYRTGDVDHETASSFHKILNRSDFENKTENLAQVIEKESGIQVQQAGGLGSYSTVMLRGASEKQVLVFLDGILLSEAAGGGVDLSNISLDDVQSIEIYKGSSPVNFSKSSIGGVINIKTLRNKRKINGSVSAGYGSFNTLKGAAYFAHKPGKLDYILSADYMSCDNDYDILNNNGTRYYSGDDRIEKRNNNEFYQDNFLLKTGYDFTEDVRLDFSNQFFNKLQHLPDMHNLETTDTTLLTRRNLSALSFSIDKLGAAGINTCGTFDFSWQYEKYDDSGGYIGLGNQLNEYRTILYEYRHILEIPFQCNILTLTGGIHNEEYVQNDLLNSKEYNPSTRRSVNLAAEDSVLLFNEKLIIKPLIRYMWTRDSVHTYDDILGDEYSGFTRVYDGLSPQLGIKYIATRWLSFKGNAGKYVREPSFFELFGDRGFYNGNPELREEKGRNYDAGFEINENPGSSILQNIDFSASFFRSEVDDIIVHVYDSRRVGTAMNMSSSAINGIETSLALKLFSHLKLNANYTYQHCIINKSELEDGSEGSYLPGRFMHSFFSKIEYFNKWVSIYFEYIFESGMYYHYVNTIKAPDKIEENAGVTFMYKGFSCIFEIKNIGDSAYEDFCGNPQPGRAYYLTGKYAF